MVALRNAGTRVEIRQWWVAMHIKQSLFFSIIEKDSLTDTHLNNLDGIIHRLELDYHHMLQMEFPDSARSIRKHLIHAVQHLLDSLWQYKNQQYMESDIRFTIARVDMMMLRHELQEYRIPFNQ